MEETEKKISWEKKQIPNRFAQALQPILVNLILLLEEEKKKMVNKLESLKDLLERTQVK